MLDVKLKHDSDSDKQHSDKTGRETQNDHHVSNKRPADEPRIDEKQLEDLQLEKRLRETREETQTPAAKLRVDNKRPRRMQDVQSGKHRSDPVKEDLNKTRSVEPLRKEVEELRKHEDLKKDRSREERRPERPVGTLQRERTRSESKAERPAEKPLFER